MLSSRPSMRGGPSLELDAMIKRYMHVLFADLRFNSRYRSKTTYVMNSRNALYVYLDPTCYDTVGSTTYRYCVHMMT